MISPTAYTLHARCPRAWWYRYVAGIKPPQTGALENGSAVHAAVETYLTTRAWPESDAPAVAQARRAEDVLRRTYDRYVGAEVAPIETAATLDLTPRGGVDTLSGRVDWHGRDMRGEPWVIDHKTTASPDYWLTPERLATDPQLLAYAGALFPSAREVTVGHLYIPPAPVEPTLVVATAHRGDIDATLDRYAAATVSMAALRTLGDATLAEARTSGCWAYGGCAYGGICAAAPESLRRRFTKEDETMATTPTPISEAQAALRARLGLPGGVGTPAPSAAPQTPAPATEPAILRVVVPPTDDTDAGSILVTNTPTVPGHATPAVARVEASPTLANSPGTVDPFDGIVAAKRAALLLGSGPTPAYGRPGGPAPVDRPSVLPPDAPKRTRKPRGTGLPSTKVPGLEDDVAALPDPPIEADVPRSMPSAPAIETGPRARHVVLVGCASSDPATSLEDWADGILHGARVDDKGHDHGHYLLVPFGGGPRTVAAQVAAALATGRLTLPRRLAIPADHPVAPFLVPTLARYAEIVRSTR